MKKLSLVMLLTVLLSGCVSYNSKVYVPNQSNEAMAATTRQIQAAERAERKEARQERREELMDEADAYNRAYRGLSGQTHIYHPAPPVYIVK